MLLGQAMAAKGPALDPDAAVDLETIFSIGVDQLKRAAPLPVPPPRAGVRVDAARAEHLLCVHDNRDRRDRQQVILYGLSIAPTETVAPTLPDHIRVHAVIRRGPSPASWKTAGNGRRRVLLDDIIEKDVGLGVDIGRLQALPGCHGPQGRRAVNQYGPAVNRPRTGAGLTSIGRIANKGSLGLAQDLELEGLRVETPVNAEARVGNEARETIGLVRPARGWRLEIACGQVQDALACQLGADEEVVILSAPVEPMNGENVLPLPQELAARRNDNVLEDDCAGVIPGSDGHRVPGSRWRSIAAGHLDTIEIGDKAIVIAHSQLQQVKDRRLLEVERDPQPGRRVDPVHLLLQVGLDQSRVADHGNLEDLDLRQGENIGLIGVAVSPCSGEIRVRSANHAHNPAGNRPAQELNQVNLQASGSTAATPTEDILCVEQVGFEKNLPPG